MPKCMCDFEYECAGTRVLCCRGCGGDLCVCAACYGHGEQSCPGCVDCQEPDDMDFDDWEAA